jgi:hypothetical protein
MKKKAIILLTACICSISAFTQDSYFKDRWNFKLGGSTGPLYNRNVNKTPQIRAEANYGILNYLEVGGYLGISNYWKYSDVHLDTISGQYQFSSGNAFVPFYGVNANFHLFPFLIKKDDFRFDLYLAGKAGGYYLFGSKNDWYHGAEWQFFLGGGLAFYPWKHFGIYTEYGYEKNDVYSNNEKNNTAFRFGLTWKYKK